MNGQRRTVLASALALAVTTAALSAGAQGIRVEVVDAVDGDDAICALPGELVEVELRVTPGDLATTCARTCSGTPDTVTGGTANLAAGAVSIAFDTELLTWSSAVSNPDTAARDGLVRSDRAAQGRVGWALAGDWVVDGDPTSALVDPCGMDLLDEAGWVLRLGFAAGLPGQGVLHLRNQRDDPPFAMSFADLCNPEAFTLANGNISAATDAVVLVSPDCDGVIFFDAFETGDASRW